MHWSIRLVCLFVVLTIIPYVFAADPPVASIKSSAEERLLYMQSGGDSYSVKVGERGIAKFQKEPVLRFTNPVSG